MSKQITALFSAADREKAQPILDALRQKGFAVADEKNKTAPVLLFLSAAFAADGEGQERFFALESAGREIIPVDLDGAAQPELVKAALIAKNAIAASGRTAEEIASRVASAEAFQKKSASPKLSRLLIAAAAVLILGVGLWIWRSQRLEEPSAVPAPAETEVALPDTYGLTEEDLAKIVDVVIVGDKLGFFSNDDWDQNSGWPGWDHFAYLDEWNDQDAVHWYSVEDGHEMGMQHYDDLRVIELMPNLHDLTLVLVDTDMLPDLSRANYLNTVTIQSCGFDRLDWLAGSPLTSVSVRFTPIRDFAPLNGCKKLNDLGVDMFGTGVETSFTGFAPTRLTTLWLWHANSGGTIDLSSMENCKNLLDVYLGDLPLKDLNFLRSASLLRELSLDGIDSISSLAGLEGMPLSRLTIRFCGALRDVSALGEMASLKELEIRGCDGVRDISALAGCTELRQIELYDLRGRMDFGVLSPLPNLRSISIGGTTLQDVDFLEGIPDTRRLQLRLDAEVEDLSGLRFVKNYDFLHFSPRSNTNPRGSMTRIYPYLEGASVRELEINNCTDLALDRLPTVTSRLDLSRADLENLEDLPAWSIATLGLDDLQYLTSLDGLEHLSAFSSGFRLALEICNCPRLEDWSALENTTINRLRLEGQYYLPRFETIEMNRLELSGIPDMEDLRVFDAMEDGREIEQLLFRNMESLRDISALRRLKIDELSIPPQVAEQADELVESGAVKRYEVLYPDDGWSPDESEVKLLSLDELDTLPKALLRRVRSLNIAGDRVVDTDRWEVRDDWDHRHDKDTPGTVLVDRETDERISVPHGKLRDLSVLSDLTGLEWLQITGEPLENLDGVQSLENLKHLIVHNCPNLSDASAAFAIQELEELDLGCTKVSSIQGVQNLSRLVRLRIWQTKVTDISPLGLCDFSYASGQGGAQIDLSSTELGDFTPLAQIGSFRDLGLNNQDPALWLDVLDGCEVYGLSAHGCGLEQAQLEAFLNAHRELEVLQIPYNNEITDLTPLLEMENLRYVLIDRDMKQAVASLNGKDLPFELEIW